VNRRVLLAFGAAIVVAGAVILLFALRARDELPPSEPTAEAPAAKPTQAPPPVNDGRPPHTWRDRLAERDPVAVHPDGTREYDIDGTRVRDHTTKPPSTAPVRAVPRADGRVVTPAVTQQLATDLRAGLRACVAGAGRGRGRNARVVGNVKLAIRGHQLSVTDSALEVTGIDDAASIKGCLAEAARAVTAATPDEADVEDYELRVSLLL
jgi:hypothetical protein